MSLPCRVFDKDQRVTHAAIVENKRLSEAVAFVKDRPDQERLPRVKTNSEKTTYQRTGRKSPGRKTFVDRLIERRVTAINPPARSEQVGSP